MGEPLANYKNVMAAARASTTSWASARATSPSAPWASRGIGKLAEDPLQVTLAVSLHQATDAARSAIMPVNDRYDLETLLGAVRDYQARRRRGYGGSAKNGAVDRFQDPEAEFGVSATPRVPGHRHRRGLRPADDVVLEDWRGPAS
ncbi:hypothetical protein JL720_10865 [Aureococcus anophagefferens]|nr:hypothetical protein JL720_10865 [Aureococcus anophagefferens]